MGKICSKCKNPVSDTAKFCKNCGASKDYFIEEKVKTKKIFCPECGTENSSDDKFCENCGFSLIEDNNEWNNLNDDWKIPEDKVSVSEKDKI